MKLFISWSGQRSRVLAEAFRDWIPLVLHYVEPWLSESDIEAGERWAEAVAKELESSNFGIICVTRENVDSSWILFEAGALAKSMQGSRVIPLLLDLDYREITGPLAQFQAKKIEKAGVSEVIHSLNKAASDPVPDARVKQLFDALWPELEKRAESIPDEESAARRTRPQSEVLEELVASVRGLDSRFRDMSDIPSRSLLRRGRRWPPFMMEEMSHMIAEDPGDPVGLLVIASVFREDLPWLYELGTEAYRAVRHDPPEHASSALRRFQRAAEVSLEGPFSSKEMGVDPRELHMMIMELQRYIEQSPAISRSNPRRRAKKQPSDDVEPAS